MANKDPSSQNYGFSSSHVWMWELDCEEGWALKNWCIWTVVLEKTLESPLDCREIQPVHPKGNQSWMFIRRTDAEAETLILWPPDAKNWLIGKDPDAGKDWKQEKKGKTEDETVGWHHRLDGHKYEQALGVGDGQRSLVCCSPWGHKESDMTEQLNWTEQIWIAFTVTLGTTCDKKICSHYWGIISLKSSFFISEALLVLFFLTSHTWEKFNLLSQLRCMIQNPTPAWVKIYIRSAFVHY